MDRMVETIKKYRNDFSGTREPNFSKGAMKKRQMNENDKNYLNLLDDKYTGKNRMH